MQCMIVKDTDRMYGDCCRQSKNEDVSTVLIVIWKRQILVQGKQNKMLVPSPHHQ